MIKKTLTSLISATVLLIISFNPTPSQSQEFTTTFNIDTCSMKANGINPYFIIEPGYQLVLQGTEDNILKKTIITGLDEYVKVTLASGRQIKCRVIEEQHFENGVLVESSRNFMSFCKERKEVYYFGEEVQIFEPGGTISDEGSWLAGESGAQFGMLMPGSFLLSSRYMQEMAPDTAMDQAEHTRMGLTITVPAGTFNKCVEVKETTPLDPGAIDYKIYCPGVGLVMDGAEQLVSYGFIDGTTLSATALE